MKIPFALPRPLLTVLGAPLIATALFYSSAPAFAQGHTGHGAHSTPANAAASPAQSQAMLADGEVKKVDKAAGKVTVSHGPLTNLGMPAMTMVFRVKDAAWLDQMKNGDKIHFAADNPGGVMTVVKFEPAK